MNDYIESLRTKKRKGRSKLPLTSYGPEWKELWLRAAKTDIYLSFPDKRRRNAFRLRSTQYRYAAAQEKMPEWEALYAAECHTPNEHQGPWELIYRRKEAQFADVFATAGIVVKDTPLELTNDPLAALIAAHGGKSGDKP